MDSVLNQSFTDFEVLLVDDASTDGSFEICKEYADQDSRIKLIHNSENKGLAAARNKGTVAVQGEYITYIDGDDIVAHDYLDCLFDLIKQTNADIAVCNYQKFNSDVPVADSAHKDPRIISGREACEQIVNQHIRNMIVIWGKLYKQCFKDLLIMPEGRKFEDEFICYKLMYNAKEVSVTKAEKYYYRQRENSLSKEKFSMQSLDRLDAFKGAADWLGEKNDIQLQNFARKRYLMAIEIMWRKAKLDGADKTVLYQLNQMHCDFKQKFRTQIRQCCNIIEKFSIDIFSLSPTLYSFLAGIYLKAFNND